MSALSGLGAKGEKGKGKFTSININNIYKGTSASTQKSTVSARQHGLQSLGKVGGTRRMPPPAHLPSLRSENSGNDPNINLVPTGSSGWGSKEEQERMEQMQQQQPPPPQTTPARAAAENPPQPKAPDPGGGRLQPSPLQQPVIPPHSQPSPQGQKQGTVGSGGPPPTHGANIPQGANTQQTGGNVPTQSNNGNQSGGKSWSSVTMGGNKKAGGFLDQKSPFFQEEFPSLVSGGEEKSPQPKKEEEKEPQYGPGPSLRPQNVGNWKEGGGRGAMQQQPQLPQDQQQNGPPTSGGGAAVSGGEREADRDSPVQPMPPHAAAMMRPGQPMPMGPGGPMIPPHFRGMIPPYMFGRGGFPPGYPPNFHPGMQRPPYPYPGDQRFRAPNPAAAAHMGEGRRPEDGDRDVYKRPAIIKDQDLKEFDDILSNDASDGGWAGAQGEIDYSEKLVFSDDEENGSHKDRDQDRDRPPRERRDHKYDDSERDRDRRDPRDERRERGGGPRDRRDDDYRRDDRPRSRDSADKERPDYERQRSGDRGMYGPREAWGPHPGQYGRGPMDRPWQGQMPFDQRGPPPGGFPPQFRMGPRGPGPAGIPHQRPGPGSPLYPPTSTGQPPSPSGSSGPPPAVSPGSGAAPPPAKGDEDDDMWNKRRRQQNEEMAAAVERARQRRDDEERRIELERKAAAQEKLKRLEEKLKEERSLRKSESEKERSEGSDAEHHRSRTGSESSDKGFNKGDKYGQGQYSRQYSKNMPPRFQKQHSGPGSDGGPPGAPVSPQTGQPPIPSHGQTSPGMRHGPPHWYPNDPRAWGGMPPPGYGPGRPPMDMQGMPMHLPMRRGRTDSGSDSHEGERRTPEMSLERDVRLWAERPMPFGPVPGWDEHMRRGGPMPGHQYFDQRGYSGDYEHDERLSYEDKRKSEDRESDKSSRDEAHAHRGERDHKEPRDAAAAAAAHERPPSRDKVDELPRDSKPKDDKRERRDSKDSRDSRDSKKDKDERSERERSARPPSDEKHHVEDSRPKRERGDRRNKDHTPTSDGFSAEGWGDHMTDFRQPHGGHGQHQGFRGGSFRGRNEWGQYAAPPPISAQQVQETMPARSNLTSLKRKDANNAAASEKKDSSKDNESPPKLEDLKIERPAKDVQKDGRPPIRDSRAKEDGSAEGVRPKGPGDQRQDSRPQRNKDQNREDKRRRDDNKRKGERRDDRKTDRRDDARDDRNKDRPPTKRMKDDDDRMGSRRGRGGGEGSEERGAKSGRGRGASREFVGRGRSSRGRSGFSTARGRGARGRGEFRGFDGKSGRIGTEGLAGGRLRRDDSDHSESEDWQEHVDSRRRTKGEDSDVSVDEASASVSESSSEKIHDSRESSKPRDAPKEGSADLASKDKSNVTPSRDVKNPWGVLPTSGKPATDKGAFPTGEAKSELREHMKREERKVEEKREDKDGSIVKPDERNEKRERRDDRREDRRDDRRERRGRDRRDGRDRGEGRYKGGGHQQPRQDRDGDQGSFTPRGEPSRRGRGGHSRGGRGRGGGGGGAGGSAPPKVSGSTGNLPENRMSFRPEHEQQGEGMEGKDKFRKPDNRDYRFDRNAPPPRFSRSASGGRGGRGGGGAGFSERGRGGRGRGARGTNNPQSASRGRAKPQLQKQNSSDMGNEEWETASESSDVLDRRDSKNELKDQSGKEKERKEAKKSFSSQRPSSDRQNRRANSAETRNSAERSSKGSKERSPNSVKMNGAGPATGRNGNQTKANKTLANSSKKENTAAVYRVDDVVYNDPTAVQNALNKSKTSKRSSDLSDVSKPLKSEKEKKPDALANIDINNYASVVVIDDQPEVSIDDPAFFFESNEGFQEVTSKKQQKKTIKAAQEEAARLKVQDEKKEKPKKGGKGRGATSSDSKRMNKLPPRLAKQRAEKEKEKQQHQDAIEGFMPKIEAWDNELANNIPPPAALSMHDPPKGSSMPEPSATASPPMSVPFSMGMPAPAPAPTVNAWEKPISITPAAVPVTSVGPNGQVKFDPKADQHDSGIDISEPQNSNSSSTRSSPSAENKLRGTDLIEMAEKMEEQNRTMGDLAVVSMKTEGQFDMPKPQRQSKSSSREKQMKMEDGSRVVKKPEAKDKTMEGDNTAVVMASSKTVTGMEPIQLPASFKEFNFSKGEDSSDMKLDFTFDAELAKLTEEKAETKEVSEQMNQPISMSNQTSRVSTLQSPTSPATEDLNLKIASVKNVWESMPMMPTVFEHSMGSVAASSAASVSVSDAEPVSASQHFSTSFNSASDSGVSVGPDLSQQPGPTGSPSGEATVSVETVSRKQEMSATAEPFVVSALSHGQSGGLSYIDSVVTTASSHLKAMVSEQSNVCKVKPQLQNFVQSSAVGTNQSLPLQAMGLGNINLPVTTPTTTPSMANVASLTGIPSPPAQQPVLIAAQTVSQYHPFSLGGSQLLAQDSRQYSSYGAYGLSQTPQAASAAALAAPAQTTYTQPSLFLPTAPAAAAQSDLYGSSSGYRSQYGGSQQPSTMMVSSTSTASTIKPPSAPSQFNEFITGSSLTSGKGSQLAPIQYGQLVNNAPSLQPSGMYVSFDPSQSVNTNQPPPPAAPAAPAPTGNLSSSQLISSQLVQPQRASVQGLQTVQPQSSFYSQQTPLQQTGFYQAQQANPASSLGVMQQVTAQSQYSVQGFGTQPPTGLNLSLHSAPTHSINLGSTSTLNKAAAPFKPASQQHQAPASQLKSPPQSGTPSNNSGGFPTVNSFQTSSSFSGGGSFSGSGFQTATTTQSSSAAKMPPPFNSFAAGFSQTIVPSSGGSGTTQQQQQQAQGFPATPNLSQPPPPVKPSLQKGSGGAAQQTYSGSKVSGAPYVGQSSIQSSGNLLQAQLMMGIRPSSTPAAQQQTSQNRFQNAIQRPMMMPQQQRQGRPPPLQQTQQSSFEGKKSQQHGSQTPTTSTVSTSSASFSSSAAATTPAGSSAFRAQQAKARAELLAHAQSFLNPNKKPAPKKPGEAPEGGTTTAKEDTTTAETPEETSPSAEEKAENI